MMHSPQHKHEKSQDVKQHALYQQAMLAHHKSPVGFNDLISASHQAKGVNSACGDEILLELTVSNNVITALAFHGDSCAICRASASMLCQYLSSHSVGQAISLSQQIRASLSDNVRFIGLAAEHFAPLMTVQKFPVRKQCALLPWSTLEQALQAENKL